MQKTAAMYSKRIIFWSSCAGMLLFGIAIITLGSIAPDLSVKLELDEIDSGTLFSILPVGILAGSLLFGPVADRFGYRILLSVSSILLFAGLEGLAYAPDKNSIMIFVFLTGMSGGAINGATNALMADISGENKGANLSLLGAFFGLGALGMPLALGLLRDSHSFESIVTAVGGVSLAAGLFCLFIKFPPAKQSHGIPLPEVKRMIRDNFILLVSFFLFFQSSFEGVINNWTTTYLEDHLKTGETNALYGLSVYVAGMASMRLVIGSVLRKVPEKNILFFSYWLILSGLILIIAGDSFVIAASGLFLVGAGLAPGFPMMLGFTGSRYAALSGTAFSIVLSIALIGNMSVNYLMGIIAKNLGIQHLTTIALAELLILSSIAIVIMGKINSNSNK